MNDYCKNIGKKVTKCSIGKRKDNHKPFKSGLHVNTVKDIIIHPILNIPAYTFIEDDTYVECRRCKVVKYNVMKYELNENDLKNQETFFKYEENVWYDKEFEFQIRFNMGLAVLSHHSEIEGDTWFIKYLKNLKDLKKVYEAIRDKEFK